MGHQADSGAKARGQPTRWITRNQYFSSARPAKSRHGRNKSRFSDSVSASYQSDLTGTEVEVHIVENCSETSAGRHRTKLEQRLVVNSRRFRHVLAALAHRRIQDRSSRRFLLERRTPDRTAPAARAASKPGLRDGAGSVAQACAARYEAFRSPPSRRAP